MANPEHLDILKQGVEVWNRWRVANPDIKPDLHDADLAGANLSRADLIGADLAGANLTGAHLAGAFLLRATLYGATFARADLTKAFLYGAFLFNATLVGATLTKATLTEANLTGATLAGANLTKAILTKATLAQADLRQADFRGANLALAIMVDSNFEGANLTGCWVYGIAAWNLKLVGAHQSDLVITQPNEPVITVDDMEVAQFIYLLLHNEKIRHVIDTITSKVVLILGRFTPERKVILDTIRDELRRHDLLPVLFDFQKPESRDFTETVSTLAHMARFVIADMTEPRIVLEEVPHIVRNNAVPLVPLLLEGEEEPVTLYNLRRNHSSVLPTCRYTDCDDLLASLEEKVIAPAQVKAQELREIR